MAKHKHAPYLPAHETSWFKIRNRSYSQWAGRDALFERERERNPDVVGWDSCVRACAAARRRTQSVSTASMTSPVLELSTAWT